MKVLTHQDDTTYNVGKYMSDYMPYTCCQIPSGRHIGKSGGSNIYSTTDPTSWTLEWENYGYFPVSHGASMRVFNDSGYKVYLGWVDETIGGDYHLCYSISTDGQTWTDGIGGGDESYKASVTGEDAYDNIKGDKAYCIDVIYINSTWYFVVYSSDATAGEKIYFFKTDFSEATSLAVEIGGAVAGYIDGTDYYFAVVKNGEASTKKMKFDATTETISDVETIASTILIGEADEVIGNQNNMCFGVLGISEHGCELLIGNKPDMLGISIYQKIKSWIGYADTETYNLPPFVGFGDENYYINYFAYGYYVGHGYDGYTDIYKIEGIGIFIKYAHINTAGICPAWGNYTDTGLSSSVENANYMIEKPNPLTKTDRYSSRTIDFIDHGCTLTKGDGLIIYNEADELVFIGKVRNIEQFRVATGIQFNKIRATSPVDEDMARRLTEDKEFTGVDPYDVLVDILPDYCRFIYKGTWDDQSLTRSFFFPRDTPIQTVIDDCEEAGVKIFSIKPDGSSLFDDADTDFSEGAVTLVDGTNCALTSYNEMGAYKNKIEVSGGVKSDGVKCYGSYTSPTENDQSIGTAGYEIASYVLDADCIASATALHGMCAHDIFLYKMLIQGHGCPETGRKLAFSSTPQGITSVNIIIESFKYDPITDSCEILGIDHKYLRPDSGNNLQKQINATNVRIGQVAGGHVSGGASELKDLSDVDSTLNPTEGQFLQYDATTDNEWKTTSPLESAPTNGATTKAPNSDWGYKIEHEAFTKAGIQTFSSFPVTPSAAPTTNYQTANKKYVDDNAPDAYTKAEMNALMMIGSANKRYIPAVHVHTLTTLTFELSGDTFRNAGADDYWSIWDFVPPYGFTLGALKFYMTNVRVGVFDADADDKVNNIRVLGWTNYSTRVYPVNNLNVNWNTVGDKTQVPSPNPYDCSAINAMRIDAIITATTTGQLDMTYIEIEGYYDT